MASFETSITKASGEDFDISCETCEEDGNMMEASGFCQTCEEYLCMSCMKTHCKPKPTRHHVVINQHQMPKPSSRKPKVIACTEPCKKHPPECFKFYCTEHDVPGCGDCMILEHKSCTVEFISTISEGYNTTREYLDIVKKIETLQLDVNEVLTRAEKASIKAEATIEKAMSDFKQYRDEIEAYLNKMDQYLHMKYSEANENNAFKYSKLKETLEHSEENLNAIHTQLTADVRNTSNLFVRVKTSREDLETHEQDVKEIKKTKLNCIAFTKNATISREMASLLPSQEMELYSVPVNIAPKNPFEMAPRHISDLTSVQLNGQRRCNLTSLVNIRDNIIACTDLQNKSLLLLDIARRELLSSVSLKYKPWCTTFIEPRTLAVTLTTGRMIQFYEVQSNILRESNKITVDGECRGIDSINELLVVTFGQPPKVEIIDFHGNVYNVIQKDKLGNNIFNSPFYVAVSKDGGSMYVSDNETRAVTQLTLNGTVLAVNSDLGKARGMHVCNDGSILVSASNCIYVMSKDCKKHKILIDRKRGVCYAGGIYFNEEIGALYVRMYADDGIDFIQTYSM
ncbi:hypothetical protein ACF0H5_015295 [Mactra antiquata]